MNETAWIFASITAYGIGHAIAWFFKNVGNLLRRWGALIVYFAFPTITVTLISAAIYIAGLNSVIVSIIFALGFAVRMCKRDR